jgi:hypothetical protein
VAAAVAAVVMAHGDPAQVNRLLRALTGADRFLHCDLRTPRDQLDLMTRGLGDDVQLVARQRLSRTSWSLVDAELRLLVAALTRSRAEHIVVMSGSCYPLVSTGDLADALAQRRGRTQMRHFSLPHPPWSTPRNPDGGVWRLRRKFIVSGDQIVRVAGVPLRTVRRRIPRELVLHGGSQWKVYARPHARTLLEVLEARPDLVSFFRHSYVPDETCGSPALVGDTVDKVDSRSPWYLRWHSGESPEWLGPDSFDALRAARDVGGGSDDLDHAERSPKLFARKLRSIDVALTDRIDAELRR